MNAHWAFLLGSYEPNKLGTNMSSICSGTAPIGAFEITAITEYCWQIQSSLGIADHMNLCPHAMTVAASSSSNTVLQNL